MSEPTPGSTVKTTSAVPTTPPVPGPKVPALRTPDPLEPTPVTAPSRRVWYLGAAGLVAVSLGAAMFFQPWAASEVTVAVETVATAPVTRVLAVNGRIAAETSVEVRPLVSGTLSKVLVSEGQVVTQSQDLAMIDPLTQQAVVRQALASLDAALVAQDEATATYDRNKALGENAARMVLDSSKRTMQAAALEVARSTALLDQAQAELRNFTIRAPMAGTVLVLTADPGQSVDSNSILGMIADLDHLLVETDVDESYATQIKLGQPAALQLSGETALRDGHVSFVSQKVDTNTGGLAIKLTPDVAVVAPVGLTVTANITVESLNAAITVPRAALVKDTAGSDVFVVVQGLAQRKAVTAVEWPAARLIVTEGLAVGDVVIADATGITDGQAVKAAP